MIDPADLSYKVRVWDITTYSGARGTTYRVRWKVGTNEFKEPFNKRPQADAFRSSLLQAQSRAEGFSLSRGLPANMLHTQRPDKSWYRFACDYVDHKWPDISANHRDNVAFALMRATTALLTSDAGRPDDALLRKALGRWAFSRNFRTSDTMPTDVTRALEWVSHHTRLVSEMAQPKVMREAVKAATTTIEGKRVAASSRRRNHSILKATMAYAVEEEILEANPVEDLEATVAKAIHQVDRRTVVNPVQARALLDAVHEYGDSLKREKSGPRLVAFFGAMYYAALRPEEAINLHKHNLSLPPPKTAAETGERVFEWGELHLERATPDSSPEWTDSGTSRDERPLKQREEGESRTVPCSPDLTRLLWEHLETFGTDEVGRLFVGLQGRPLATVTYRRAWRAARQAVLTEAEQRSPLARTPYALRHTCVSTWLNAGVSETLVARWAGHSVAVLKKIYAKCLVGEEERAKKQIEEAYRRHGG